MRPEAISKLNQALDAAGVRYATEIYPGTIHGYTMSDTDAFNPFAWGPHAESGKRRIVESLRGTRPTTTRTRRLRGDVNKPGDAWMVS